jgi:four helix bundle protein
MDFAAARDRISKELPREEVFGLTSQIRRSASSSRANIAEGHGRECSGSFVQLMRIAQESQKEAETRLQRAVRVEPPPQTAVVPLFQCMQTGKMLRSLIGSIQSRTND